jgi:hypothetical protein
MIISICRMLSSHKPSTFWDHVKARSIENARTSLCRAAGSPGIRSLDDKIGVQRAGGFDRLKDRDNPGRS